jgi:hypothetical protein
VDLLVVRNPSVNGATLGRLYIDGTAFCDTLEDEDRKLEDGGLKVYGQTAIPRPKEPYQVILDWSHRFQRELPKILGVGQFSGVRIHPGNSKSDTDGCLLVGRRNSVDNIADSRATFNKLFDRLNEAYDRGERITLMIK